MINKLISLNSLLSFKSFFSAFYSIATFLIALVLAWFILAEKDFAYQFWHDNVGIAEGIEKYGPKNRYRRGFADTTPEQRFELFARINHSIHNQGKGLSEISYQTKTSRGQQTLLRQPEITHLQDIAKLLDSLKVAVVVIGISWVVVFFILIKKYQAIPAIKFQLLSLCGLLLFGLLLIILVGPEQMFNTLHIWVFPKDHQWFFYYQDSLMSTMMLAPILFGWISLLWLAVAIAIYGALAFSFTKITNKY